MASPQNISGARGRIPTIFLLKIEPKVQLSLAEGFAEGFCGRFPRKVFTTGTRGSRKVLAEGFCGRFRGSFFCKVCSKLIFFLVEVSRGRFLQKVPRKVLRKVFAQGSRGRFLRQVHEIHGRFSRKVFAEGSAEGFRGRFRGRFSQGSRKVPGRFSAEG